jgi:antitoxin HicB
MQDNYPIVLFWWEEDQEWVGDVPDLPGCSASGATPEEAAREVMIARELWLESARAHGTPLPDPRASRFWPDVARAAMREKATA